MNNEKLSLSIFIIFLLSYLFGFIYNFYINSYWVVDFTISILFLTFVYLMRKTFHIGTLELLLFSIGLTLHNIGMFGAYNFGIGTVMYDNIVHIFNSCIAAFIVIHMLEKKIIIRSKIPVNRTFILILISVAVAIFLSVVIEMIEFSGFLMDNVQASDAGILTVGPKNGDSEYVDTMEDMIMNFTGGLCGIFLHYIHAKYIKNYKDNHLSFK